MRYESTITRTDQGRILLFATAGYKAEEIIFENGSLMITVDYIHRATLAFNGMAFMLTLSLLISRELVKNMSIPPWGKSP